MINLFYSSDLLYSINFDACKSFLLFIVFFSCLIFSDLKASELAFFSLFFLASLALNLSSGLSSPPVSRV